MKNSLYVRMARQGGLALLVAGVCLGRAPAQNPKLPPTFGSVNLVTDFKPDPYTKVLTAGGTIPTRLGGVNAWVANPPDFSVHYKAGQFPLIIRAESKADTTLLINLPDGTWVADDDSGGNLNPLLRFAKPASGRYDIWVGTLGKDTAPAKLIISEVDPGVGADKPKPAVTRQHFPAKAPADKHATSWDIEWDMVPNPVKTVHLLRIVSATFNYRDKNNQPKSLVVARNIELAEAFASYDDGVTAFLDLALKGRADKTVNATDELKGPPCVAPPEILTYTKGNQTFKIHREVHDDGLRWMGGNGVNNGYRGEKLVLMSIFQAVNYVYFMEYDFTDDGRIVCRLGFTAHNFSPRGRPKNKATEGDVHLHVGCWRMQFDLGDPTTGNGGAAKNDYRLISRRHDGARYRVMDEPFGANALQGNQAVEGKAQWKPDEFTVLRVESTELKNSHQRKIAYDLIPARYGSVRNLKGIGDVASEIMDFVNYDFWVTRTGPLVPYHKVPFAAANRRTLAGLPATVWYSAPALHVPRGEDFGKDGVNQRAGVALTTWIEFTLRPRDVFDSTPLYP